MTAVSEYNTYSKYVLNLIQNTFKHYSQIMFCSTQLIVNQLLLREHKMLLHVYFSHNYNVIIKYKINILTFLVSEWSENFFFYICVHNFG